MTTFAIGLGLGLFFVVAPIAIFIAALHGRCKHAKTFAIPVDERGNWMQCMHCGRRHGPIGWN